MQNLLNIYGKRGWQHYYEGKIGDQVLLYFRRTIDAEIPDVAFTAEEEATTQMLVVEQRLWGDRFKKRLPAPTLKPRCCR